MFYGRVEEKKNILNFLKSSQMHNALIYGRRRVGKSELINQTLLESKIRYIYYECKQTTESNNAYSLCEEIKDVVEIPFKSDSVEEVLKYLYKISIENTVLVLDEYPYLREVVIGLDSIIQTLIDQNKASKLKLILCGSYLDVMKSLVEHENPLFGRFDYILELKPMNYYESQLFYNDYSFEDKVKIYSVFGGIPYYNRLIDTNKTVEENIVDLISSDGARLENEISFFLTSQLRKINNANQVFSVLAKGYSRFSDILAQSKVSSSPTLIDVLDKLISLGVVEKIAPINDENNKKKTGYYISDNLAYFYYKYIYQNTSKIRILDSKVFYDRFIKSDFESKFVPLAFEKIVKEYLIKNNLNGLVEEPFYQIGKYYYDDHINKKNGEFDIVTLDSKGYIFYEVKYRNRSLSLKEVELEIEQVKNTNLTCYKYGFVSKSGFDFSSNAYILLTLEDIYR